MLRGFYENAGALVDLQHLQSLLANNLANQNTPGYLSASPVFESYLSEAVFGPTGTIGAMNLGVGLGPDQLSTVTGTLQITNRPLDVAPAPNVFLAVRTPAGVAYTRDGALTVNAAGFLTTATGLPVLGQGGAPIRVGSEENLSFSPDGTITAKGKPVGRLELVQITGKLTAGTIGATYLPGPGTKPAPGGTIMAGALVLSNVNAATTLSAMAEVVGLYQANEEAAHTQAQSFATFLANGVAP
jgi:flagellar basal-body rod protein FlgF